MLQVQKYFTSNGKINVSAGLIRDIVESNLVEEFHWLPQDIAKISYKWIKKFFIIRNQKQNAIETNNQIQKFKSENKSGKPKKFTREI